MFIDHAVPPNAQVVRFIQQIKIFMDVKVYCTGMQLPRCSLQKSKHESTIQETRAELYTIGLQPNRAVLSCFSCFTSN